MSLDRDTAEKPTPPIKGKTGGLEVENSHSQGEVFLDFPFHRMTRSPDGPILPLSWFLMRKKILVSWSSGKDSAWALHVLRQRGEVEVVGLLTTINRVHDRVAMRPNIAAYLASKRRIPFNQYGIFRHYPELDG